MSYSYADNVSEHSYFSSVATERPLARNQNGSACFSRPCTSRFQYNSSFMPRSANRPRITLPNVPRNNSLDERIAAFASSNQRTILDCPIQFVPAKRAFGTDSKELKSKYICITGKFSIDRANATGQTDGIRAYPTKTGFPKLLNGNSSNGSSAGSTENGGASVAVNNSGIPPPSFEIFPADGIHLQWDASLRRSTSVGLNNLGNTCFLNSILQVLTNTAPLVNYLLNGGHDAQKCPASCSAICALCVMKTHISRISACAVNGQDSWSPSAVVNRIRYFMRSHTMGRQEDAHEFLRYFIDAMQTAALFPYKDQKLDVFTKETSVISRIFGGYHKNEIVCNSCHSSSVTFDPFLDLNVEIKQSSNSLETALSHFTGVETLASDNAYLCPKCNRHVSARKIFTISQPPNILTIQLKRFDHFGKIDRFVSYPERLNLRPYMTEKQGPPVHYKLYGVIVHVGRTTHSGHYFAFVKNPCDQWHLMDDSRVSIVSAHNATRTPSAYLLFYVRLAAPIASVKPQAKPKTEYIGPQQAPAAPASAPETTQPAQLDLPQPGFKLTFSEIRASPVARESSPRTTPSETLTRTPITPIVTRQTLPQARPVRTPVRFRLIKHVLSTSEVSAGPTPTASVRPKSFAATPIIVRVAKPIQDSSVSSSTKLVPYDDEDDEGKDEGG